MTSPTWMGWKSAGVDDEDILLYPSRLLESCAVRKEFRRAVVLLYIRWLTEPAVNIRAEGPRKKAEVRGRTGMSARLLSHRLRLPYTSVKVEDVDTQELRRSRPGFSYAVGCELRFVTYAVRA